VHGFCVPISDLESLVALLRRELADRQRLSAMRADCARLATEVDWSQFRQRVADFALGE
jgi:hypothetical protein